ncbi:TPA: NADH:ubiquinone oxidoreductase [Candidatus Bipolaricaulota bacterium]|nr:NADH:ubiquinone oxidoreductase [Candidatus Bipolaricaulota bacterium]
MPSKIPIGPYHPLQEEPEHFVLTVEGERVIDIDVSIGYNHRGIEKLAESKTYDQTVFLVERICGICSTSHPLAFCLAVEDCAGLEVPERANYIRTIIDEFQRLHSHLLWLGLAGHFMGYNTVWMWAWKYREPLLELLEVLTGNRQHYGMMRVGGVRRDIPPEYYPLIRKVLEGLKPKLKMLYDAVRDDPVIQARLAGVGRLSPEDALRYGVLGPTARASGIEIDIRRDYPYGASDKVEWRVITSERGDMLARVEVRLLECLESIKMIEGCLERMSGREGEGPISSDVPRRLPPGEGIGQVEAPRGECFHYVVANGTDKPERLKIRAPTYMNLPSFRATCIGETVSDVVLILAGIDPCYCCTERSIKIKDGRKETTLCWEDLLKLSWEKTARLRKELGDDGLG